LDSSTNKLIHTMEDVKAPHAIFLPQGFEKLFIVEGDASAVKVYDSDSYKLLDEIKVPSTLIPSLMIRLRTICTSSRRERGHIRRIR